MILENIKTEDLQAEIDRRKRGGLPKPKQIENPNIKPLVKLCQDFIDILEKDGYSKSSDPETRILESAMTTFFGENVWEYIQQYT
jgi:hypothetical protein